MLAQQRTETILEMLRERGAVSVTQLCQVTGASEATIRRDLNTLAQMGKLNKVHGGAVQMGEKFRSEEPDVATKRLLYMEEKRRIGQYAAGLIQDDDIAFLDSGTTVMEMVYALQGSHALFVTNNAECAFRLRELDLRTYIVGGMLKSGTLAIIGAQALACLEQYNFTKAFLGTNGIALSRGFTTPDPEEAAIKRLAAQRAREVYVLADSSKFGTITASAMFSLADATIITDHLSDERFLEYTQVKEV